MVLDLFPARTTLEPPERLTAVSSWHSHIPFAFWCVEALRPRVIVELGTHRADSYCAFCQAVDRLSLPTACFAVDTWKGDKHSGEYGDEVLDELRAYHDARYGRFSRLVRATFDEAVSQFADGSIDLLHVDGLHTYEAVKHDFETWLPKLSRSAVVLFHDTNVRDGDFGVWRLWEEVSRLYPHFSFLHGHGLGVLVVGTDAPEPARRLAFSGPEEGARVRSLFSRLGATVGEAAEQRRLASELARGAMGGERDSEGVEAEAATLIERRRAQIAGQESEIGQLRAQLEESRARVSELERQASKLERQASELERRKRRLEVEGGRLTEELSRSEENLAAIRGSCTFKVAKLLQRAGHSVGVGLQIIRWTATLQLRTGLRKREQARLIRRSGLFQAKHYLGQLSEVAAAVARKDPVWHFLEHGADEGLDPNPLFDTSYYVEHCPESAAPGSNPLVHFIRTEGAGGCDPSPLFDTRFYVERYADVRSSEMNPLAHYLAYGYWEGRACIPAEGLPPEARHASRNEGCAPVAGPVAGMWMLARRIRRRSRWRPI